MGCIAPADCWRHSQNKTRDLHICIWLLIQTMDGTFEVLLDSPGLITLHELLPLRVVRTDVDPPVAKPFASDMVTINSVARERLRGKEKVPCWPL